MIKKRLIAVCSFCAAMLLCGCVEDQYAVEKRYWKVKKQAEQVFGNPEVSPPGEVRQALASIDAFIARYPKNVLAMEGKFLAAKLYLAKKDYDTARGKFSRIKAEYKALPSVCAEAQFLLASAYQLEGDWDRALEEFRAVYRDYPLSERGFEAPVHIAQYYKVKLMPEKMIQAYEEAAGHYKSLMARYPHDKVAFRCYNLIGSCYVEMKKWPEAIQSLQEMAFRFKGKLDTGNLYVNMALIYSKELNDKETARKVLRSWLSEGVRSAFTVRARTVLADLEKDR